MSYILYRISYSDIESNRDRDRNRISDRDSNSKVILWYSSSMVCKKKSFEPTTATTPSEKKSR